MARRSVANRTSVDASALLRTAGLRRTPVRVGVIDVLGSSASPLGVPDMLSRLPRDTDAVTVYRTLNAFTRKKLVHRVRGEDQAWRYALSSSQSAAQHEHRHPHFVCETCGTVQCLAEATIPPKLSSSMHVNRNYTVNYAEIVLHGTCPRCK